MFIRNAKKETCKSPAISNWLESYVEGTEAIGVTSCQDERCLSMEHRMINSLRVQGMMASFLGLWEASSRW